jgi:hypothetical protein
VTFPTEEGAVWFLRISFKKASECGDGTDWLAGCGGDMYGDTLLEGVCFRDWKREDNVSRVFETQDELDRLLGW